MEEEGGRKHPNPMRLPQNPKPKTKTHNTTTTQKADRTSRKYPIQYHANMHRSEGQHSPKEEHASSTWRVPPTNTTHKAGE